MPRSLVPAGPNVQDHSPGDLDRSGHSIRNGIRPRVVASASGVAWMASIASRSEKTSCVAITHGRQGRFMQFGCDGGTAIIDDGHQVAQIARVTHGRFHAFVRVNADDEQGFDPKILQHVVKVG